MVCDKCEKKLKKVITPDVAQKPLYKVPQSMKDEEEKKEPTNTIKSSSSISSSSGGGLSKIGKMSDKTMLFNAKVDEPSLFGSNQRTISGMNMALGKQKYKFDPTASKCRICKVAKLMPGHYYCSNCSYLKGICSMCGKKILDIKMYKQTNV
eukprot:403364757